MEFMNSRPDIVRSNTQRWLLSHWDELRAATLLPAWHGLKPDALAIPPDDLSLIQVVAANNDERFQIRFHGTRVASLYGRVSCVGKFLDEILPASALPATLAIYCHVVAARAPVYTVTDLRDRAGRIVHYERLLLPFCGSGSGVERILASLETVSPEGEFDNDGLMTSPVRAPAFALCTTIHY
jgi:hypothetical protein